MEPVADEFGLAWTRLEGRYDIEHVVASGGFGVVYFGRHRALKSPAAVKVLRVPDGIPEVQQRDISKRFLEEAQIVAALQHPSVVRVLDFGSGRMPNGKVAPWAVFEWVEGETLNDFLAARNGAPMAPKEILALLKPVFEGLAAAHALGIAHRDVKPANIMLPKAGTSPIASRILDFGIAKAMHEDEGRETGGDTRTRSKTATFSLKYAAPEQLGGLRTGPWTDVHALGLIVTQALVGREPYDGKDFMEIASNVIRPQRPTPAAFGVDVGGWEPLLARAVAIKTSQRFRDAAELCSALEAALPTAARSGVSAPLAPSSDAQNLGVARTVQTSVAPFASPESLTRPMPRSFPTLAAVAAAALFGLLLLVGVAAFALRH